MSVFTVYFCGTSATCFDNHHPNYWNGELVSTLAANSLGREFADWIIVDGPGSGNLQADTLTVESQDHPYAGPAFGKGWETNVRHALNMIKGEFEWQRDKLNEADYQALKKAGVPIQDVQVKGSFWARIYDYGDRNPTPQQLQQQIVNQFRKGGKIPSQVNLVGWSRGGISCHMLANAMLKDPALKHIPVNIFAIDPVPGLFNFQPERVNLGSNVREYVGFYARDERSKGFACVIPKVTGNTRVGVYPMPGRHATLVGNAAEDGVAGAKALPEPGMVVRHLAETCLQRWGVELQKCLKLDAAALKQAHDTMHIHDAWYANMRKYSYTYVTEADKNERAVSHGTQWAPFSAIGGAPFTPAIGLAAPVAAVQGMYKELIPPAAGA
ncbi:hypothetical protein RAM80_18455 [Pseudomonas sp. App30]|uniref:hypothetical protein n=1 Tax=Pseudomonas sp. App30 TaxID=3068990 RepID=UPI003A7F743D